MHTEHPATGKANAWLLLGISMAVAIPALVLRFSGTHLPPIPGALTFGLAILGAAFVISWTAEAAEHDISQALALAVLAFIAVLPEYAVDLYFAWTAPYIEANRELAIANMTGANRLLIGLGWSSVFFIYMFKTKQRVLHIDRGNALELAFLAAATIYSFSIPFRAHLSLVDTVVLIGLFGAYVFLAARRPVGEPELVGPAEAIGNLPTRRRRAVLLCLFLYSAVAIFASAEPFAESLVETGTQFGISKFLLVQWVAPLASEAPEFIIASSWAFRGRATAGMVALISSKVNQWTLLVGSLPLAYAISGGSIEPMHFDERQVEEVFLTAAQSAFAVAVFLSLSLSRWEASALAVLFATQLVMTDTAVRLGYGWTYLALMAFILLWRRQEVLPFIRSAYAATQPQPPEHPGAP